MQAPPGLSKRAPEKRKKGLAMLPKRVEVFFAEARDETPSSQHPKLTSRHGPPGQPYPAMTSHPHKPIWQRYETWLIAVAVLIALLFILPHRAGGAGSAETRPADATALVTRPAEISPERLPFGVADVAQYFSTVLEMSAERGPGETVRFENLHVSHPEDRWFIAIWAEGSDVVVEFRAGGDWGMNLAREFFESALFERGESEQFYAMLNDARNGPQQKFPRFTLQMQLRETVDLLTLTLRFTPPLAA